MKYAKWTVGRNGKHIYERMSDHWRRWTRQKKRFRRRSSTTYKFTNIVTTIDIGVQPITVKERNTDLIVITHKGKTVNFEDDTPDTCLTGWILPQVDTTTNDEGCFAQQLIQGEGITVSDGSFKNHRSSAAFTTVPEKAIKGSLTIPGHKNDQSSYRAELGGILASIVFTNKIAKKFDIQEGKCTMICDNKGALDSSFGFRQINPRWQCFDLLCMIRFHIANSPIKWKHKHVKGHQDRTTSYEDLDDISQANVDVDKLAKIELERMRYIDDEQVLPGQCWRVKNSINEEFIQGDIETSLRHIIYEEEMKLFWKRKLRLQHPISEKEWSLFKKVNSNHEEWEHLFAVKLSADILPTKDNMIMRKHDQDPKCPCCDSAETNDHLLYCRSTTQAATFTSEFAAFKSYLQNITSWKIKGALLEIL